MFELKHRDGLARICRLETAHGTLETPVLLPVINPNQLLISPREMKETFKIEGLITNSYIIFKNDHLREPALEKGVHELIGFEGTIMTDSGTFQSHVYGDIELDPIEIVKFQRDIGSDIGTILDVFSEPDDSHSKVKSDLEETLKRAKASVEHKGDMLLAGTVQGGIFEDLRAESASRISELACDVVPIGGVVPLMESQRYADLVNVVMTSKQNLDPSKPVHLFGCGHPMMFSLAALMGCDIFDSSAYAKFAKNGRMLFVDGTRFLAEMKKLPCECPVCYGRTPDELTAHPEKENLLAMHNLHVSFAEIKRIKQAIHEGRLWEMVEQRCRGHPKLLDGLKQLRKYKDFMEKHEPLSRELAFLHTSPDSYHRPVVARYQKRLAERFETSKTAHIVFPESHKPYHRHYKDKMSQLPENAQFWVDSYFGPAPMELDEMYPIAQSVIPEHPDAETIDAISAFSKSFFDSLGGDVKHYSDDMKTGKPAHHGDIAPERVRAVADMQFGKGASAFLFNGNLEFIKSKKTGKIRNVIVDGEHVLSMRASTGFFTLKPSGAERLHAAFPTPKLRVITQNEPAEFNREGKNVFAKFVLDADPEIVPGDEVLIVNESDELAAIGRALLTRDEMLAFKTGIAVKVREGIQARPE